MRALVRSAMAGRLRSAGTSVSYTFRALRVRNYRLFWTGQLISLTGTWAQEVAQAWLVLKLTNSPLILGTVVTVRFLPTLLFSLFGGVFADRFPKRRVLFATQTTLMLQALVVGVLVWTGAIQLVYIYIVAALRGLVDSFDQPTRQAFIVELVGPDELPNAVALNSTQFNAARIVGPAIGGILVATVGIATCYFVNAASFLVVLWSIARMRPREFHLGPRAARGNMLRQVGAGLRYSVTTPDVALVLLLLLMLGTFGYNFPVVLPLLAKYTLHTGAGGLGLLMASLGVGSLVAALAIAYTGKASRRMLFVGAGAFSLLLFAVAAVPTAILAVPLLVALGFASILFMATANTLLQLGSAPQFRGRVMSLWALLFMGTTPIGSLVIGWLSERWSVRLAVEGMAVACMVGVGVALLYLRRLRRPVPASAGGTA